MRRNFLALETDFTSVCDSNTRLIILGHKNQGTYLFLPVNLQGSISVGVFKGLTSSPTS